MDEQISSTSTNEIEFDEATIRKFLFKFAKNGQVEKFSKYIKHVYNRTL
jgi:hypothetical protein